MSKQKLFTLYPKDFRVDTFRGSGAGGQNRNKRDTGIRVVHIESGASAECCEERQQGQNKKRALQKLIETPKFRAWLRLKAASVSLGFSTIEQQIEKTMSENNLKIEYLLTYYCDGCTKAEKNVIKLPEKWTSNEGKDYCPNCTSKRRANVERE